MPSKEECKRALKHLIECKQRKLCDKCNFKIRCTMPNDELVIENLIKDHFELKEKYSKILDDVHDYRYETHCMKMAVRNLCEHFGVKSEKELQNIYLNKPYKFEDLKPDLWVWDDKEKVCIKLTKVDLTTFCDCFKEMCENKRLYPVQMANEVINNVRNNEHLQSNG